jgi:hypothetical protein
MPPRQRRASVAEHVRSWLGRAACLGTFDFGL